MRKMLAILASFALCGTAFAGDLPDRSTLSYEENATINTACAGATAQGASAFQACVMKQIAALQEHPTPDRSELSPSRNRAILSDCSYLRRTGIAPYNDCIRAAMAAPQPKPSTEEKTDDELRPNYTQYFTENASDKPQPVKVAMASLPKPGAVLPQRPDHIEQKSLSAADLFKKVERSVFVVLASPSLADARTRNISQGSAVAISEHLLLTNCHVVRDRPLIKIMQDQKAIKAEATLVAADPDADRCVLEAKELTLVPIGGIRSLDSLTIGERVFAVGSPFSLERTLSEGLISGIRHNVGRNLIQTSAPVSPGSSGGGLFDDRGNLIGITTLGSTARAQNLNFAVAASDFWR